MDTNGKRELRVPETSSAGEGLTKWILSALGLFWIFSLTARSSRRSGLAEVEQFHRRSYASRAARSSSKHWPQPVRSHEQRDASVRWIMGIVVFLLLSVILIQIILGGYLGLLKHKPTPTDNWQQVARPQGAGRPLPPEPRLQISPPADLQVFRRREEAELHSYGWVNRTSGIVRIPIERAMDLVLQQGLPTRPNADANQVGPSSYDLIQRRLEHRQPEIQGEK